MNLIFLIIVCISPIVGTIIIYNLICFLISKKDLKNIDIEKIREGINKYKRSSIYSSIILGFLLAFIFIYTRPVSIYEITGLEGSDKIESLDTWGSISYEIENLNNLGDSSEIKINYLSEDQIEKIFSILDNYNYKRIFNYSGMGGIGEFFSGVAKDGDWITIKVWRSGYLRIPNDEIYRINLENREDLYEELAEEMKKWK